MSPSNPTASKPQPAPPDALLLALVFALAFLFAVVLPPFQLSDEHAHFIRAYTISQGHFIGSAKPALPPVVAELIQRYPEAIEKQRRFPQEPSQGHMYLHWGILGSNVYCPIAYLPASLAILGGRLAGLPPLALMYAARLANLSVFVAALFLVFRLAPEYRLMFAAIALLPMTLHQVSGVTADSLTIASTLVAVSALLWFRYHPADRRALLLTALLFSLWVVCKMSPWAFGALLLIPVRAFPSRRSWVLYVGAVAACMVLSAAVWQVIAQDSFAAFRAARLSRGIDMTANISYLKAHPAPFVQHVLDEFRRGGSTYAGEFVGAFGWTRFALPAWARSLYLLLLVGVAFCEPASKPLSWIERVSWLSVLLAGVAFLHVILFVSDGGICGEGATATLCFNQSAGIQGRYFLPLIIFGLVAIRHGKIMPNTSRLRTVLVVGGGIHALASILLIWSRFWA